MADLRSLAFDLAGGRLSRRRFVQEAVALGVAAPLAAALARNPATALAAFQDEPTGPAADKLLFSSFNVDQAALNIQNNDMDIYLFGLKTAAAKDLEANGQGVRLITAPASTIDLLLNPCSEGDFNPFSIKAIRKAMQFLVDRDFIANDIYQGRAVPMYSHVSPLDYDELTVFETVRSANFRYDPEYARGEIEREMTTAGATRDGDGPWSINGQPITLKFIIRVEDERRDVGDTIRVALEQVGFQVAPQYQPFGPAIQTVQSTDPKTFQWHLYTEGYGRGSASRYDSAGICQFTAPWFGNMPGWRLSGFWQYEQPDIDALTQRIYRGEFGSQQERDDLYRQATGLAIDESVRIFLANPVQSFPARVELQNVTEDIVSGPKSIFTLREATVEGKTEVRVGHLWVWTEQTTWNPVGGFGDIYSTDIYKNMVDAPVVNHPFTGLPIPFRATFEVETAGPTGKVDVPEDAVMWDAAGDVWKPVGSGLQATTKVTYDYSKYFQANYHHGQKITPADLMFSIAESFEFAYDEQRVQIETALGVTSRPYLETFRGVKLLDDDRLEVYVDFWHFEEGEMASYAGIGGLATPWELQAAMNEVVFVNRQAAYSNTAAARYSVPWLSLVTEQDARLVTRVLRQFAREQTVPAGYFEIGDRTLVTPEEAVARYEAAQAWFDQTNLLVISNGPFTLSRYDPPAQFAELDAYRDPAYPFHPGEWLFGVPERLAIQVAPPPPAFAGDTITVPVTVSGPGTIAVKYVLVDPAVGQVAASGDATPGDAGTFNVTLDSATTGNLFPSIYQLYLLASSDAIAQVAESRVDLEIGL
jgi:peptide/nickel transport system substrate-binding protein